MADFLPEQIQSGDPTAKVPASFYTKVDEVLSFLEVHNGYIAKTENFWRIVFDPSPGEGDGVKGLYHFKIIAASDTTIRVLGGSRIRDVAGAMSRVPLTGDGGDSPTWDLYKTVTISASVYVWVEFDDPLNPAALTVNTGAAYPDPDNDSEKLVLGYVTFASGAITGIEQYWTGGDWRDEWIVADGVSLNYNAAFKLQQYGWATAASTPINDNAADYIEYKDSATGQQKYTNLSDFSVSLINYWGGITFPIAWSDLSDTVGDPTQAGNAGYIPRVTDQGGSVYKLELIDLTATGVGPFWVKGAAAADCYGEEIGNDAQQKVIDLDLQQLNPAGGVWTLDWAARQLDGADWTVLAGTIFKVADTTVAASGDGSIENQGGYYGAGGIYVDKGGATRAGYFANGTIIAQLGMTSQAGLFSYAGGGVATLATATTGGNFIDGTRSVNLADGTYAVNAIVGGINANATTGYWVGGNEGLTADDAGTKLFEKGCFVNDGSWTFYTIQVVIPGTGLRDIRILGLIV